jgi:cell division septum initiation protein DivIVA
VTGRNAGLLFEDMKMSEKKEVYRVKRTWVGGPELGAEVDGPIPSVLLPNVERVLVSGGDTSKADTKAAAKVIDEAKAEAAKILDQARTDADGILNDAKLEAAKILEDAADKVLEEATKPAKK